MIYGNFEIASTRFISVLGACVSNFWLKQTDKITFICQMSFLSFSRDAFFQENLNPLHFFSLWNPWLCRSSAMAGLKLGTSEYILHKICWLIHSKFASHSSIAGDSKGSNSSVVFRYVHGIESRDDLAGVSSTYIWKEKDFRDVNNLWKD